MTPAPAPPPVIYALLVMKALKLDQLLTDSIWGQALIAKVPLDHFLILTRSHRVGPSARFQ